MQQPTYTSTDEVSPSVIVSSPAGRLGSGGALPAYKMWQVFFVFVAYELE
jgi:hypothetical protein